MAENMKPLKGFKQGSDAIGPRKGFSCYCEGWAGKEEPVSDTTEALVNAENGNWGDGGGNREEETNLKYLKKSKIT